MGVDVHVDLSGLNRKLSAESLKKARKLMANDALQAMDKWVPYLEGNLSRATPTVKVKQLLKLRLKT